MIYASTIGYATTPSNSKLLNGKVKHIGRIRHNNTRNHVVHVEREDNPQEGGMLVVRLMSVSGPSSQGK